MRTAEPAAPRLSVALALVLLTLAGPARAQAPLDHPMGEPMPYALDSGPLDNPGDDTRTLWSASVFVEQSAWLRLHLASASLPPGSFLRLTSVLDGESQELDAVALAMWRGSTAYLNGEEAMLELVAGPGTRGNRLVLDHVTLQLADSSKRVCGICDADDRTPSTEPAVGRLMPTGCSASVYCEDGGLLSAGHCGANSDIVEFNVPPSNADCTINHPPVEDQFPITDRQFSNVGPGNDWAVFSTGVNNLGETIYERYGAVVPVAKQPASVGDPSSAYGYGGDGQCVRAFAQQLSPGVIKRVATNTYTFDNDVRPGSSGSPLVVAGRTVAVVTHCSDTCTGTNGNLGTRVDRAEFAAARESMSVCEPPDVEILFDTSPFFLALFEVSPPDQSGASDGTTPFGRTWDAGTSVTVTAPAEPADGWCFDQWLLDGAFAGADTTLVFTVAEGMQNAQAVYVQQDCCTADFNGDGAVDTRDVIAFLNAWSNGDSSADIDGNGVIDTRDVIAFLNLWGAGC